MSLLDTIKQNLTPEQFATLQDALGDDFDWDVVPRSRLNQVIKQRNEARQQLSAAQGAGGSTGSEGAGSEGGAGKQLTQADIEEAVKKANEANDAKIAELHKRYAVTAKLREANFVDPELVLAAGLIDLSKITTDANGAVTGGLDDQVTSLTESKPYMVAKAGGSGSRGTGKRSGSDEFAAVTTKEEFLKLSVEKQLEFKKANPEVFKGFLNQ